MSIEAESAVVLPDHETETALLHVLGSILRNGTFGNEEVETIATAANDCTIDEAVRCFAGQSLQWLAQQSAMVTTPIWERNSDARH